ncbi:hypothetical protein EUTSA_v10007345mg [Eutrema salsugineum]|uniref:histidinol-phosphate transaminase n=3 Tax=Eutrema salsugineum TaxID=72664 RepID=V4L9X2_EUTSA|nr:hypothetical protein EUTSA_v10007345mg [Eutrema salsugineum]
MLFAAGSCRRRPHAPPEVYAPMSPPPLLPRTPSIPRSKSVTSDDLRRKTLELSISSSSLRRYFNFPIHLQLRLQDEALYVVVELKRVRSRSCFKPISQRTQTPVIVFSFFPEQKELMGVIDVQGAPSFSIHCSEANFRKSRALKKSINRVYCVQASSAAVDEPKNITMGDSFIRPHLKQLAAYQPILPFEVLSAQLGRKPEDIVKLDANENPYGPPPEVLEALGNMKFPYVYPDPQSRRLRDALAKDSGLESEYILVGCGADELIDLIMRCVLDPGEKIIDCPPTFSMYAFDAAVNGAGVIKVPRNPDFSLNVDRITEVVELERPKCIFLTSPNNPDGSIISEDDLLKILEMPVLVVLDEAYIEFSGLESRMKWVKNYENLIVLRTFSKRAGLAGLRVGYGAFPLSIIEYMWRAKQPYNVSVAGEVAALAALSNGKYLEDVRDALVRERERLFGLLNEVPFLNPYPSHSNFILCEVTSGMDAKNLKEDLAKMGVMVRHYNSKELKGYVRVSAGKPEHTNALMDCLKKFY